MTANQLRYDIDAIVCEAIDNAKTTRASLPYTDRLLVLVAAHIEKHGAALVRTAITLRGGPS